MTYHPEPGETFSIDSPDGLRVAVHAWRPAGEMRGALLFLHGMAEHARRYAGFAGRLMGRGWAFYAPDLRGHGLTAGVRLGIAGDDGWNGMVRDAAQLLALIRDRHPDLPVIVGGYSMGSILAQRVMQLHGDLLDGAVLIASGGSSPEDMAVLVAAIREEQTYGSEAPSQIQRRTFHEFYNVPFQPVRTLYDWLSRDDAEVDAYIADPLCGISLTTGLITDYISAMGQVMQASSYDLFPRALPVLILHGSADSSSPLEGFQALMRRFAEIGMQDVSWRLYPDARHDLLHETNREIIAADLLHWLDG